MFIIRAMRDYPSMKFMGRKVLRRMSTVYKFVNTSMVSGFNAFVSVLQVFLDFIIFFVIDSFCGRSAWVRRWTSRTSRKGLGWCSPRSVSRGAKRGSSMVRLLLENVTVH